MELVAYLHGEILSELLQQGESIDQHLDCKLIESLEGSIANSSHHAKSILCMGLVAGAIAVNIMPTVAFAYSSDVASVQELLAKRGFSAGAIDGIKGSATTEAIIAAQTFYGLEADGVIGSATIAALQTDSYEANPSTTPLANQDSNSGNVDNVNVKSSASTKNLQQLLSDRGFYGGEIDGIYGAMTEEAVLIAQRKYGLIADGVAGSLTIAALETDQGNAIATIDYGEVISKEASNNGQGRLASGDSITQAQTLLSELGFYDGAIDGIQGDITTAAIKKAQAFYGITVDGVIGSETLAALQS